MLVEEEVTKEESAELETSADGSVSAVTTEDGSKIDLSSADVQKETSADGSTTYKMADGSQVVVDSSGSAKVIKTETVTKVVPNTTVSQSPWQPALLPLSRMHSLPLLTRQPLAVLLLQNR